MLYLVKQHTPPAIPPAIYLSLEFRNKVFS